MIVNTNSVLMARVLNVFIAGNILFTLENQNTQKNEVDYMNIESLRVFDYLHKLKLSEEVYKNIEEEQSHTERTGISIKAVINNYYVCISHDEEHKIIIKEISKVKLQPNTRILLKTLVTFDELPEEVYTLHGIVQYRAMDDDIKRAAHNIEELKDCIIDRFIDKYPKKLGESQEIPYYCRDKEEKKVLLEIKKKLIEKQLNAIYWLFGEQKEEIKLEARPNVAKIIKVFQRKNRRMALIKEYQEYEEKRGGGYGGGSWTEHVKNDNVKVLVVSPSDDKYNYVSPGREFYIPSSWTDKGQIWLDDDLTGKISGAELQVLSTIFGDRTEATWMLLNADNYNKMKADVKIELMAEKRKESEKQAKKRFGENIKNQFENGKTVRKGIIFTPKNISYQDYSLEGPEIKEFIVKNQILLQEEPDFNKIFEDYVTWIMNIRVERNWHNNTTSHQIGLEGKKSFRIKDVRIEVEKDKNNFFVNNMRICKDDLWKVLKEAINYDKQEDYDAYIKKVNILNLKLRECLEQGAFTFELKIDKTRDNCILKEESKMLLSIPYNRKNNKNYVTINNREYKVKDVNSLLALGEEVDSSRLKNGYLQRTIKLLYKAIEGITPKTIADMIKQGVKEHEKLTKRLKAEEEKIKKKSEEFLANAVRLTKAERAEGGWVVTGISGTKYTINSETLAVYTLEDGKPKNYLCIVDVGNTNIHNDRLAKRILALAHDTKVAKEIYTLGDHLDKHWNQITEEELEEELEVEQ